MHERANGSTFIRHMLIQTAMDDMKEAFVQMGEVFEQGVNNVTNSEENVTQILLASIEELNALVPVLLKNMSNNMVNLFGEQELVSS